MLAVKFEICQNYENTLSKLAIHCIVTVFTWYNAAASVYSSISLSDYVLVKVSITMTLVTIKNEVWGGEGGEWLLKVHCLIK